MYVTSLAVNHEDGSVTWHKVRFYGELADLANAALKRQNKVALLCCEGYVRNRSFIDRHGNDRQEEFVVIPGRDHLKVLDLKDHIGGSDAEDPFAAPAGDDPDPSIVTNAERPHSASQPHVPEYQGGQRTVATAADDVPF
jgi:single-stranded DNA-binding protein